MDKDFVGTMLRNAGLKVEEDRPLAGMTTFRIGGPASWLVRVRNLDELRMAVATSRAAEVPWFVLGGGSNVVAPDAGFPGVVVRLAGELAECEVRGDRITAGAGLRLAVLCREAAKAGFGGLEFAAGIPGTVGGGLVMNAGAWGGCLLERVERVTVFDAGSNEVLTEEGPFPARYRSSPWQGDRRLVLLSAVFRLEPADPAEVAGRMRKLAARRRRLQPVGKPSAGSVFRNPEGLSAGRLIDEAGLKGLRRGGAMVSVKHANFIVNTGGATAEDVRGLARQVREEVERRFGVRLEPEIEFMDGGGL